MEVVRALSTHGRAFGGGEEADVDAAHHEEEQRGHRPYVLDGEQALAPGRSLARRARGRIAPGHVLHGAAEQDGAEDPGKDSCREQPADIGLGEDPVDHHDGRRGDHDAEGAPARHHARGEPVGVAEALHGRIGHLGEGGGGGDRRAADSAETRRGPHRGHGQPAPQVADEGVGGAEELLGHARAGDEVAHEDEQRHHGEGVVASRLVHLGLDGRGRHHPVPVAHIGVAHEPHHGHGERDGHPQAAQHHHGGEPDEALDHRRSSIL